MRIRNEILWIIVCLSCVFITKYCCKNRNEAQPNYSYEIKTLHLKTTTKLIYPNTKVMGKLIDREYKNENYEIVIVFPENLYDVLDESGINKINTTAIKVFGVLIKDRNKFIKFVVL